MDLQTKQTIGTLKMNGSVNSVAFSSDSRTLYSFGGLMRNMYNIMCLTDSKHRQRQGVCVGLGCT